VAERVADSKVLGLIRQTLEAGALRDGVYESAVAGTPQGGVISPLLSNIYLHVFDEWMERAGFQLTRYADLCRGRHKSAYAEDRVMPTDLLEGLPGGQVAVC
jgi:RNA-directed DNA polymerase